MRTAIIAFPNGNRARAVHVPPGVDGAAIAKALELPPPHALLLHGGAASMSTAEATRLRGLVAEFVNFSQFALRVVTL